jgi:hypothetical protein
MMDLTLSLLALVAGGVTLECFTSARTSQNNQEEGGFRSSLEARQFSAPVTLENPS